MVTTWPAFTEAMYLLGAVRGAGELRRRCGVSSCVGDLEIAALGDEGLLSPRARALMEQYQDLPMDLADATLVVLAEERGFQRVFSLDRDFRRVYRLASGRSFDVIP